MASSKRPKFKRKSKARQTTLTSFTTPTIASSRRTTRGTGPVVDTPVPLLAQLPAGATTLPAAKPLKPTKKPKQQITKLEKPSVITSPTLVSAADPSPPPIHTLRSPNFAVVIYTKSKKGLEKSPQPETPIGSWFQPGVRLDFDQDDQNDVFPILEQRLPLDQGNVKKITPQGTGNTTDEDMGLGLASTKKRRVNSATETLDNTPHDGEGVVIGTGKKSKSRARTETQGENDGSGEVIAPTNKRVRRSKRDEPLQAKYDRGGNDSVKNLATTSSATKKPRRSKQVEPKETGDTNDDPVTPAARRNTSKGKGKQVASKEPEDTSEPLGHKEADGDEDSDQDRKDDLAILSQKRSKL